MSAIMFGRYRMVAFDGRKIGLGPDTAVNRGCWASDPSHGVIPGAGLRVFGTPAADAVTWDRKLLHLLDETMLVLMGRGFDAAAFRRDIVATKAQARGARGTAYTDAARAGWGELMELAGIAAGLVLAAGALVVLAGLALHVWVVRHPGPPGGSCTGRPG